PDGELVHLPFETLPTRAGRRLLAGSVITSAGSGRDVLRCAPAGGGPGQALGRAALAYEEGKPPRGRGAPAGPPPPGPGGRRRGPAGGGGGGGAGAAGRPPGPAPR